MFASIIFNVANSSGNVYYVYLVQELPQCLDQMCVMSGEKSSWPFQCSSLALVSQACSPLFAIHPVTAIWPKILLTQALNCALIIPDDQGEVVKGWKITRYSVLFQLLASYWFAGNPVALIVTAYGQNFDAQAETYTSDRKMAHYAKLPPRAIFHGQMISAFCNCFICIGVLN
jgi:hypothetical protein